MEEIYEAARQNEPGQGSLQEEGGAEKPEKIKGRKQVFTVMDHL
jgi:hypothetical protein